MKNLPFTVHPIILWEDSITFTHFHVSSSSLEKFYYPFFIGNKYAAAAAKSFRSCPPLRPQTLQLPAAPGLRILSPSHHPLQSLILKKPAIYSRPVFMLSAQYKEQYTSSQMG